MPWRSFLLRHFFFLFVLSGSFCDVHSCATNLRFPPIPQESESLMV